MKEYKDKILIWLFAALYLSVAFVSTYHAISFFSVANPMWLAVILAISFEVGQAAVLFSILTDSGKTGFQRIMPWCLMGILTTVQVLGNVFSSYKYCVTNCQDEIVYFTKSILFFVQSPDQDYNNVMISYIIGAILPVVALFLTAIVAGKLNKPEKLERKIFD